MVNIANINGAGYNPLQEDIPYNLYENEPYDDQGLDENDELIETSDKEITLSTGQKKDVLQ